MNIKPQINYHEAIKRWCRMVDEYNEKCPSAEFTRTYTTPGGEVRKQVTSRKQNVIRASVKSTGMYLIGQYSQAWQSANRGLRGMAAPADVYLRTNRKEMGAQLVRSERSVYDHLRKLIEVGLVDKYEFCGRQHSFKLWISPEILFGAKEAAKTEMPSKAPKIGISPSVRQNLPPSEITQKQHSTTISKVECGQTQKHNHGNSKDPHGPEQKGQKPLPSLPGTETGAPGGRAAGAVPEGYQALEKEFMRLPKFFKDMVFGFWFMARTHLYNRNIWSDEENLMAALEIYRGIFGKFAVNQLDRDWSIYYNELTERVSMARAWFEKNANRRPDAPFPKGRKPGYFDPKNNFGFAITAGWLAKDQLRKRQNRVEYLLNQSRIDFERLAKGNPRPSHAEKTELQLFVYYQNWAKTYGKEAEDRFHTQYLEQKARKFAPAKPPKLTIRAQKAADKAATVVYVEPWMEMGEEGYYSEY